MRLAGGEMCRCIVVARSASLATFFATFSRTTTSCREWLAWTSSRLSAQYNSAIEPQRTRTGDLRTSKRPRNMSRLRSRWHTAGHRSRGVRQRSSIQRLFSLSWVSHWLYLHKDQRWYRPNPQLSGNSNIFDREPFQATCPTWKSSYRLRRI